MKRRTLCLAAACCLAMTCFSAQPADAASSASYDMQTSYADWRQYTFNDDGMLRRYVNEFQYQAEGYFISCDTDWYDSGEIAGRDTIYSINVIIPRRESAMFYVNSEAETDRALAVLQTFYPEGSGDRYYHSGSSFTLREQNRKTLRAVRRALTDAGLTACFYENVPVYEQHALFLSYLTCYTAGELADVDLQGYLDGENIACTLKTGEHDITYAVPDEKLTFAEHWALALQFYHDLGIVPEMISDLISSQYPIQGAAMPLDVNSDLKGDTDDVRMLLQYLLGEGDLTDPQAADVSGDGIINAVDLSLMKRALLRKQDPDTAVLPDAPIRAVQPSMPSVGTVRIPVFTVSFPDYPFFPDDTQVEWSCFGDAAPDLPYYYPFESIAAYYTRASYGRLRLTGDVFQYTAEHPLQWYTDNYARPLADEIMTACSGQMDFTAYDADADSVLDAMLIALPEAAGKIDDDGDGKPDWWPFSIEAASGKTYDGVRVGTFGVVPFKENDTTDFVRKAAHELCHAMGLPDYYRTNPDAPETDGLSGDAGMELMDEGKGDLSACSKLLLGWIAGDEVQVYTGGTQTFYLETAPDVPSCILIPREPDAGYLSEYFLIEYMAEEGNHSICPGSGIRVLHVQAEVSEGNFGPELTYSNHGLHYDKSDEKQRVLRLVNDYGCYYPGTSLTQIQDTVNGTTAGFHWYDADGGLTVDTGLEIRIGTLQSGPFYSADRTAWISGIAGITITEAA